MDPNAPSPDELLAQSAWIRRLAQNILRDPALAEDAAQLGSIAAWQHGPIDTHARASWLATTVRRLAGRLARGEARRSTHERSAARGEALPSAAELVERAEAHRGLVGAVLALDEPYRSTILLRFVEDLPPRAIARRAGVPVATVKTRLARGLERLRRDLEVHHRDAREWLGLLVPFTPPFHAPSLILGTTLVKSIKLTTAVLLVLLLATGTLFLLRPAAPDGTAGLPSVTVEEAPSGAAATPVDAHRLEAGRLAVAPQDPAAATGVDATPPSHERLSGRVLDLAEKPISGASIRALYSLSDGFQIMDGSLEEPARELAETASDEQGRFVLELPYGMLVELRVSAPSFGAERLTTRFGGAEIVVHLGPSAVLLGEVTRSGDGSPVVGALVRVNSGAEAAVESLARTDALGRYRCEGLAPGNVGIIVAPEEEALSRWEQFVLEPGQTLRRDVQVGAGERVRGRVLDQRTRAPIAHAEVTGLAYEYKTVHSDAHGEFEIGGLPARQLTLSARAPGYGRSDLRVLDAQAQVELLLAPGRSATGRVIAPDGRPLADAFVAATAADFAGGTERSDVRATRTAADGRFELTDLRVDLAHVLAVRAAGSGTLFRAFPDREATLERIDLGDIALESGALVEGCVVDDEGKPRPGFVVLIRPATADPRVLPLAQMHGRRMVQSDARGRFVFRELGAGDWTLIVRSESHPRGLELALRLRPAEFRRGVLLRLGDGLAIEGWVGDELGRALAGAAVAAFPEDGSRGGAQRRSDADGRFRVGGLLPGRYTLKVSGPRDENQRDGRFETLREEHVEAGSAGLELRLVARSSSIRGRVLDAEGLPLAGAFVWRVDDGSAPQEFVLSDEQGRFEIQVVRDSTVQLFAQRGIPLAQALRTPTRAEHRAGRIVADDQGLLLSPGLRAGSTDVELRLKPAR